MGKKIHTNLIRIHLCLIHPGNDLYAHCPMRCLVLVISDFCLLDTDTTVFEKLTLPWSDLIQ